MVGEGASWQATVIGRSEIWPVHQRVAELGGHSRTGLEDTFYLPDGTKADSNGPLIEKLAEYARNAGRDVASPQEARGMLGLKEVGAATAGACMSWLIYPTTLPTIFAN